MGTQRALQSCEIVSVEMLQSLQVNFFEYGNTWRGTQS